ncbi:hypothetical protein HNW13_017720 [Shewanella sp. BF02_Schw]|uniref:hypothetical protein n=1 Tax=Shewanella sp. BF02_Schw TaxID=394908 RepID=UPI001780033A|nr:hypothetical protein [Shewanella sp. BF02_Schw]MBO1897578.1 hypothetical protein [Shewanella sp. BF02_Schw]
MIHLDNLKAESAKVGIKHAILINRIWDRLEEFHHLHSQHYLKQFDTPEGIKLSELLESIRSSDNPINKADELAHFFYDNTELNFDNRLAIGDACLMWSTFANLSSDLKRTNIDVWASKVDDGHNQLVGCDAYFQLGDASIKYSLMNESTSCNEVDDYHLSLCITANGRSFNVENLNALLPKEWEQIKVLNDFRSSYRDKDIRFSSISMDHAMLKEALLPDENYDDVIVNNDLAKFDYCCNLLDYAIAQPESCYQVADIINKLNFTQSLAESWSYRSSLKAHKNMLDIEHILPSLKVLGDQLGSNPSHERLLWEVGYDYLNDYFTGESLTVQETITNMKLAINCDLHSDYCLEGTFGVLFEEVTELVQCENLSQLIESNLDIEIHPSHEGNVRDINQIYSLTL